MKVYAGSRYITDGKKIYYYTMDLHACTADYHSFTMHPVYKAFAKDKENYYFKGEKVSPDMYAFEVSKEIFSTQNIDPEKHFRIF